ncbi:MAG TPA: hypothetical protein VFQ53_27425 [Kofleriaceae bacterium]|nr:hypothetical protein [Kofleriaceae bacterium]
MYDASDDDQDYGSAEREERAVYAIIAIACTPVVIAALSSGDFDGGATLCALVVAACVLGLVFARARLPRAVAKGRAAVDHGTSGVRGRDHRNRRARRARRRC